MTDISTWLGTLGLEKYASTFLENEVDLAALAHFSDDDLKELGLPLGPRRKVLAAIKERAFPETTSRDAVPGERRVVAVLFADLVGYTRLSSRLDAEEMHELLQRFFSTIDTIVEEHGGRVDKHIGDCVMAVFGAPVAHGNDAERAVRAALAVRAAMAQLRADLQHPIEVHLGVASGPVVAGGTGSDIHTEYTVTGETVNLASRLVGIAKAGEILLSETLWKGLANSLDGALVGTLEIDGFAAPVPAFRVTGWHGRMHTGPLVGRQLELEQLRSVLSVCRERGRGRVVLIRGEAGIGKTRLLDEVLSIAHEMGFRCHTGLVLDFGVVTSRTAVPSLARALIGIDESDSLQTAPARITAARAAGLIEDDHAIFLSDLIGTPQSQEMRALYDAMDNATREAGARAALICLIERASRKQPLVLAVEDVHWADRTTLTHLACIAAMVSDCPAVLIMTSRLEQDPIDQSWRSQTGASPMITIDLAPLHQEDAALLAAPFLAANKDAARQCIERAAGNPLFLEQLLRHMVEGQAHDVPASIQSLIQARLDRLEPSAKAALQAASVLGQRFDVNALTHILGGSASAPEHQLDQLMIRRQGRDFLFNHALIRDAIYNGLLKSRRRELHRRAADWFATCDVQLRAEHLDRADAPEAAGAYLQAARSQAAAYRYDSARRLVERGLELARTECDHFGLAQLKGEILQDLGETSAALAAFEAALAASVSDADRCRALIGRAQVKRVTDDLDGAFADLESAERIAVAQDLKVDEARLRFLRGNLYFPRADIEGCLREHRRSLELAQETGAAEDEAAALGGLGDAEYVRGRMMSAHALFHDCVDLSQRHGFGRIEVANRPMAAITRWYAGETQAAIADVLAAIDAAARVGHRRAEAIAHNVAWLCRHSLGQFGEAAEHAERALALARQLQARRFEAEALASRGESHRIAGSRAAALADIEQALAISRETGMTYMGPIFMGLLARATSDPEVRRNALASGEAMLGTNSVSHNHLLYRREAIDISLESKSWDEAERHAAALEAYTAQEPLPWSKFYVERGRALAAFGRGTCGQELPIKLRDLARQGGTFGYEIAAEELRNALARITTEPA